MHKFRTALLALALTLVFARLASAQSLGVSAGGFYKPNGHPHVHFAGSVQASVGKVGVEFLHAAAIANRRPLDLFAYSATVKAGSRPSVSASAGFGLWRQWICLEGSCGASPPPDAEENKFAFHRGPILQLGVGWDSGISSSNLRAVWTPHSGLDAMLLFGIKVGS